MEIKKETKAFSEERMLEIILSGLVLDIPEIKVEEESFFVRIIRELSEIRGEKIDIKRPVEVAEFLCPEEDFGKEDTISLYDLLNYLVSEERNSFLCAVAYNIPYFLAKTPMNNKYKAMARLEYQMLGMDNPSIWYYIEHTDNKVYEDGTIEPALNPEVLCNKRIYDYLVDVEDKEISYIRRLFQDEKINKRVVLFRKENSKQLNKNTSN